jgi:hypothetical protein
MNLRKTVIAILVIPLAFIVGCSNKESGTTPQVVPTKITSTYPTTEPYTFTPQPTLLVETVSPTRTLTTAATLTLIPTSTATVLPTSTPDPRFAQGIKYLLKKPFQCDFPCLWGVIPEKTSVYEAQNIFHQIGIDLSQTIPNHYDTSFSIESGAGGSVILNVSNSIITGIRFEIGGLRGINRNNWAAYSMDQVLNTYGNPTKIDFFIDGPHEPPYSKILSIDCRLYYENIGVVILYSYGEISQNEPYQFCPNQVKFQHISIWYGNEADDIPGSGNYQLDQVSSLSINEFSKLLIKDPQACINLKIDSFSPKN